MVRIFFITFIVGVLTSSCGTPSYSLASGERIATAEISEVDEGAATLPYVINSGDKLSIKFYVTPELNEEVQVQPDGLINLRLVGSIDAQGKTPARLAQYLELAYGKELVDPKISVVVEDIRDFQVYVGGEVARPQSVELAPHMTPIEAILSAGGALNSANLQHVVLIRKSVLGQPVPHEIDLQSGLSLGSTMKLKPLDIVYVPKSRVARLNVFVQQYIGNLLLFRGFSAGYDLNTE